MRSLILVLISSVMLTACFKSDEEAITQSYHSYLQAVTAQDKDAILDVIAVDENFDPKLNSAILRSYKGLELEHFAVGDIVFFDKYFAIADLSIKFKGYDVIDNAEYFYKHNNEWKVYFVDFDQKYLHSSL